MRAASVLVLSVALAASTLALSPAARADSQDVRMPASHSGAVVSRARVTVLSQGVSTIPEGGTALITGRLINVDTHAPVVGQKLTLRASADETVPRLGVTLVTDKAGYVRLRVKPTTTTGYDWRFTSTRSYLNYYGNDIGIYSCVTVRPGIKAVLTLPAGSLRPRISGTTSRTQAGRSAVVERLVAGGWHPEGSVRITSTGTYSFLLPVATRTSDYRLHLVATSRHAYSSSNIVRLQVF